MIAETIGVIVVFAIIAFVIHLALKDTIDANRREWIEEELDDGEDVTLG